MSPAAPATGVTVYPTFVFGKGSYGIVKLDDGGLALSRREDAFSQKLGAAILAAATAVPSASYAQQGRRGQDQGRQQQEDASKKRKQREEWGDIQAPLPQLRNGGPWQERRTERGRAAMETTARTLPSLAHALGAASDLDDAFVRLAEALAPAAVARHPVEDDADAALRPKTLAEFVGQAAARDIQRYAILNLERAGYHVVLHVYDEDVAEVPQGWGSIEELEAIMCRLPAWATYKGRPWPIKAAGGWRGRRYRKA